MATNKRRKLDEQKAESPISAIAALRQLKAGSASSSPTQESKAKSINSKGPSTPQLTPNGSRGSGQTQQSAFALLRNRGQEIDSPVVHEHASISKRDAARPSSFDSRRGTYDGAYESRVLTPVERPAVQLSTYKPGNDNFKVINRYDTAILMRPGERLVLLGQYDLIVKRGKITVMGANLSSSNQVHRFFAPSSHSLPVIRCLGSEVDDVQLLLRHCDNGLRDLERLSPLFASLWNEKGHDDNEESAAGTPGSEGKRPRITSYQILSSTNEGPKKRLLQPIVAPPQWNSLISTLTSVETRQKSIMVCGPKSSGKSTFVRLISNRLCPSVRDEDSLTHSLSNAGLLLMDLDPGQPEYSPPGQLSLLHIQKPNFGPQFSHPLNPDGVRIFRSHSTAALSPAADPEHYMACVIDLFKHCQRLIPSYPSHTLIINTPGWILGTGLEILVNIISCVRPSSIVYMSEEGPAEVVETLKDAAESIPLHTIPSQAGDFEARTSAQLRTMQYMSYFHIATFATRPLIHTGTKNPAWNTVPLTSIPPLQIPYDDNVRGIRGILCLGESPSPEMLLDSINGCLLAIVVIEDLAAFSKARLEEPEDKEIIYTPEGLPYFNPLATTPPPPAHSYTLGMVLLRGVDIKQKRLQVLTPINPSVIEDIFLKGKSIILVSGSFDTPGWAYVEELNRRDYEVRRKRIKANSQSVLDDEMEESEGSGEVDIDTSVLADDMFESAPWVERLHGSGGRGVGARVWKVRRDLGKRNDSE